MQKSHFPESWKSFIPKPEILPVSTWNLASAIDMT